MTGNSDPYRILGLPRGADEAAIRSAFRRLALRHHPDRNPGSKEAEERFKTIVAAYEILMDPRGRERWKTRRAANRPPGRFPDIPYHHPFEQESLSRGRSRPGEDVNLEIEVASEETRADQEVSVRYAPRRPCPECDGRGGVGPMVHCPTCAGWGKVRPPPGRFYGRNGFSTDCPTCRGTAYVFLAPCTFCGGDGLVEEEREAVLRVPAGVESGRIITVRGAGHAGPRGGMAGRLRVKIMVGDSS